ncbi:YebC/PmpR family DNA-binding transcriptional regulator [Oceanobacillus bengalensis]|uniref:Probable transcriptional regulatory protein D8M05_03295 n=1 Tax=Oceanobacillus bengalensis TaxID=1435466 RepID=A0A494Z7D1_9BACI|nr:YebC/PmpR family DNA-binding transcriptional regulator [Oceanobacillus bengalensis]RKQ17926.1 YebC/PmpR family DNA-binding transcriptional regulator [Oceanobacillus bengalensis]
MAGHSKWHNIQKRKGAQDAKRGKIFMRHAKNIYTAAKQGGGDISTNAQLRTAVDKAKADNMPNDNIDRAIKKATGNLDGATFEEITYEGYGPGGVAVIVNVLTDNRNRTAADVRHAFKKNGGNLGENGSVSFMFDRKGYILITNEDGAIDEDEITMDALEAGADDISTEDGAYEIYTAPENFQDVVNYLTDKGYEIEESEVTLFPQNYNSVSEEDEEKMHTLIETLEDNEDTQDIHHNLEESNE